MYKRCGGCLEKVPVTDSGQLAVHDRPGEEGVECVGSGRAPLEPLGQVPHWEEAFAPLDGLSVWERNVNPVGELVL